MIFPIWLILWSFIYFTYISKKLILNHLDVLYFYTLKKSGSSKDNKIYPHETIWFPAHKGKYMLYISCLSVICLMNWGKSKNNNPRKKIFIWAPVIPLMTSIMKVKQSSEEWLQFVSRMARGDKPGPVPDL